MKRSWLGVAMMAALAIAAWGAGCGSGNQGYGDDGGPGDDSGNGNDHSFSNGDDSPNGGGLEVDPQNATLVVNGPGTTLQYTAKIVSTGMVESSAQWVLDSPSIGTIDGNGLFTASGTIGGNVTVQAQSGVLKGQTLLTVALHLTDNPGNVPSSVQMQLTGGGNSDAGMRWLYPYDKTVFARGLLPPTLQFGGTPPDAVYLHVSFSGLDYKGFYGASNPGQITLAPQLWTTITQSASGTDTVKVEVTKISGGQVTGPIAENWHIAQGSLKGTVYYNSYDSPMANGGAVLTIQPGAAQPTVLMGGGSGCVVCHSVSANGSLIVAGHQHSFDASGDLTKGNATIATVPVSGGNHVFTFMGLYPDGSLGITCDDCVDVSSTNGNVSPSRLMNPRTGQQVPAPGFDGVIGSAGMPTFSADGKKVAFNLYGQGQGYNPGHDMGIMDFAVATTTFSNLVHVANDPNLFPTWPAFTPDNEWIIYQLGSNTYTRTDCSGSQPSGNLAVVHVPSGTTAMLDAINGLSGGMPYVPFPDDTNKNYEPTTLPVASGGYFWAVFTSRREYGNTINDGDPWETPVCGGPHAKRKKLWVAAIDIDNPEHPSTTAHDISHPPFYLDGQELGGGNSRGFWALSPCQMNGTDCSSGDQCCSGFCRQTTGPDGGPTYTCVPPMGCAHTSEKCNTDADCCDKSEHCINGFCSQLAQ
jgi:hypothetical protein